MMKKQQFVVVVRNKISKEIRAFGPYTKFMKASGDALAADLPGVRIAYVIPIEPPDDLPP